MGAQKDKNLATDDTDLKRVKSILQWLTNGEADLRAEPADIRRRMHFRFREFSQAVWSEATKSKMTPIGKLHQRSQLGACGSGID